MSRDNTRDYNSSSRLECFFEVHGKGVMVLLLWSLAWKTPCIVSGDKCHHFTFHRFLVELCCDDGGGV